MYCYKANKQWTNYGKVPLPPGINSTLLFNLWSHRSVSGNPFQRVPQPSAWQKSGSVSFCGSSEPELNVFSSPQQTPPQNFTACQGLSATAQWQEAESRAAASGTTSPPRARSQLLFPRRSQHEGSQSLEGPCSSSSETQLPELHSKLHLCSMFSRRIIALKLDPVKSFSLTLTCSSVKAESFVFLQTCRDSAHVSFLLCIIEKV